jgi:hypothetical protein
LEEKPSEGILHPAQRMGLAGEFRVSDPALVNAATLDDLGNVIGAERLDRLIERFSAALTDALNGEGREVEAVGREAHTLVSMAGMLGCDAFYAACRTLEYAAKDGLDITAPLAEARRVRDATVAALASHRTGGAAPSAGS